MKLSICLAFVLTVIINNNVHCDEPRVLGGLTEVDANSPEALAAAKLALVLLDDSNTEGLAQRVHNIVSAQSQVVAGIKYYLTVDVGLLGCSESQATPNSAVVKVGRCKFEVFEQSWTNTKQLVSWSCDEFRNLV